MADEKKITLIERFFRWAEGVARAVVGFFLKLMGGIYIDRNSGDLSFMGQSAAILQKGGVVGIFPEGRLPRTII